VSTQSKKLTYLPASLETLSPVLNDALKSELQRLKMATGQMGNGGVAMNFGASPHPFGTNQQLQQQMFHPNQAMPPPFSVMQQQQLTNQPLHRLQTQQLQQQAAINLNMKGPVPAQNQWWGDAWSESSSS
jgi:hypothetical protein